MSRHRWIDYLDLPGVNFSGELVCVLKQDALRRKILIAPYRDRWMIPFYKAADNVKYYTGKTVYSLCLGLHRLGIIKIDPCERLCWASIKAWRKNAKEG